MLKYSTSSQADPPECFWEEGMCGYVQTKHKNTTVTTGLHADTAKLLGKRESVGELAKTTQEKP